MADVCTSSYFGKQEGDFSVVLRSICARKMAAGGEKGNVGSAVGRWQGSLPGYTDGLGKEGESGWRDWFSGLCTVS